MGLRVKEPAGPIVLFKCFLKIKLKLYECPNVSFSCLTTRLVAVYSRSEMLFCALIMT